MKSQKSNENGIKTIARFEATNLLNRFVKGFQKI